MGANRQAQVTLGYSDGDVGAADTDAFTSRLGGQPQWLDDTSAIPAAATAVCDQCGSAMVQLAQAYAPLDDSPYDRVLYIWACYRRACTGKPGAARAIRAHLLNTDYALKLVKQSKATARPKPTSPLAGGLFGGTAPSAATVDFGSVWRAESGSTGSAVQSSNLFTGPLFGKQAAPKPDKVEDGQKDSMFAGPLFGRPTLPNVEKGLPGSRHNADDSDLAVEELGAGLGRVAISADKPRIEWPTSMESVAAQYLEFDAETMADDTQIHERYRTAIDQALDLAAEASGRKGKGKGKHAADGEPDWSEERYERTVLPKGTDAAFSRFTHIVGQNPEQVMRYQFGGTPLLYTTQDDAAQILGVSAGSGTDNDDDDDDNDEDMRENACSTEGLKRCPHCGGQRVFECQIMPALLTVLALPTHTATAAAGTKGRLAGSELMRVFDMGLEFGTMLVFVCANDCHGGKTGAKYLGNSAASMRAYAGATYYEELVLVQLEAHMD